MQKGILYIVLLCAFVVTDTLAQFQGEGVGIGVVGGGILGYNKETKNDIRLQARGFIRHNLTHWLTGELGGGYATMTAYSRDPKYKSTLIPIDARFLFSPFSQESWNLYFYIGGGVTKYDVSLYRKQPAPQRDYVPTYLADSAKLKGWATILPVGIGFQFRLHTNLSLEISGGYTQTTTDDANGIRKGGTTIFARDGFFNALVGVMISGPSLYSDIDGDGLSLKIEKDIGTDPEKFDTDGDGLSDGEEYSVYFTDMLSPDGDGDKLNDADEVKMYNTDPNKFDSDGDHLNDSEEIKQYHTDPLKRDTDFDGLADDDEINKYLTNPLSKDSDDDGLTDYDELKTYKTEPLKADSDGDGLSDSDELIKFNSHPLVVDTDSGTVSDGIEVSRGTNPLDPTDDLPKKEVLNVEAGKKIVLEGVTFASGKSTLEPSSEIILEQAYNTLIENPDIVVEIQGHTDNTGKRATNLKLSQARADAVKAWLVKKGISSERIVTKGYGPDKPIADNNTAEGRQKNRRIEFLRLK